MKDFGFAMYQSGLCFFSAENGAEDVMLFGGEGREIPIATGKVIIINPKSDSLESVSLKATDASTESFYHGWIDNHRKCELKPIIQKHIKSGRELLIIPFHAVLESGFIREEGACEMRCLTIRDAVNFLRGE